MKTITARYVGPMQSGSDILLMFTTASTAGAEAGRTLDDLLDEQAKAGFHLRSMKVHEGIATLIFAK